MKRILLRAPKGPFDVVSPEATLRRNTVANNSGNLIFGHAAHKILRAPGVEIRTTYNRRDPKDAPMINETYDAFVIPLANAFRRSFEAHLIEMTELIERLTIPVIVFGVGAQTGVTYDPSHLDPIEDSVRRFMKAVLDRSATVGVRGEFTADYLRGLGFNDVEIIGCPSMFLHGANLRVEKKVPTLSADAKLAINVSPYVRRMGKIVQRHHRRYPNLVYIAQDTETLAMLLLGDAPEDRGKTSSVPIYRSHPLFVEDKVRFFVDPWPWLDFLADVDFAFGTRIHGNIAALIAGTPSYVLVHDSRTLELARYFEIPHRRIADLPPDIDAAQLYDEADYSGLNGNHHERFVQIKQFLDRNGLDHIFNHGGDSTEFDRLVRRTPYPPPVTVTSIRRRGWNGRGWRDRMAALLDLQAARVQRRARRLAKDSGSALTAAVRAVVTKAPGATAGRTTGRETAPVLVRARRRRGR